MIKKRIFLLVAVLVLAFLGISFAEGICETYDVYSGAIPGSVDSKSGSCMITSTIAAIGVNYPEPKTITVKHPRTDAPLKTVTYFPRNYTIDYCCEGSAHEFTIGGGDKYERPVYVYPWIPPGLDKPQYNFTIPLQICPLKFDHRQCSAYAAASLPGFSAGDVYILDCAEDSDCPGYPGAYCDFFSSSDPLEWKCVNVQEGETREDGAVIWHEGKWKHAGEYEFAIITIGDTDYVSNWQKWHKCGEDIPYGGTPEGYGDKSISALKFLCYEQGGKSLIAECCVSEGPNEDSNVHNIGCYNDGYKGNIEDTDYYNPEKLRIIGEPTTLLNDDELLNFRYSAPGKDVGYQNIQIMEFDVPISDWSGYDSFDFFAELNNAEDYDIMLMSGPEDSFGYSLEDDYEEQLRAPLTDYIAGSYNEWKHISIPVDDIDDAEEITQIVFYTDVTQFAPGETASISFKRFFLNRADVKYCTDAYATSWADDLDTLYEPADKGTLACDSFPAYKWTGSRCCGDDYVVNEFYKDDLAGCWNSHVVENDSTVMGVVLFYNGDYYGCNAGAFSDKVDHEAEMCEAVGNYFCDPTIGWSGESSGAAEASTRNTKSSVPAELTGTVPRDSSCCSPDSCWNGTECIAGLEGRPDEFYNLSGHTYRCVYGEWESAVLKWDWDNEEYGFCPYEGQCLVDKRGNASRNYNLAGYTPDNPPVCIDDKKFIEDHYCNSGEWTTRTRQIALALLDVEKTSGNFILYCDSYKNSLADYTYEAVEDYLGGPVSGTYPAEKRKCFEDYDADCVNNFCIIKYEDNDGQKTGFGVSLNKPVNAVEYSFLEAIGQDRTYCNNPAGNGPYFKCGNNRIVWYNPLLNAVIYNKNGIDVPEKETVLGGIANFFKTIFGWMWGWQPTSPTAIDISMVNKTTNYNVLYIQKKDSKEVYAVMEQKGEDVLITVDYLNFDSPICDSVNRIAGHEPYTSTTCNETEGHYVVYSNYPGIWQELTSTLRIS